MKRIEERSVHSNRRFQSGLASSGIRAKICFALVIIFTVFPLFVAAQTPEEMYQGALDLFEKGQFQGAMTQFESFLVSVDKTHPLADNAQYYSGECYYNINYESKGFDRAMEKLRLVRARYPESDVLDRATYKLAWCFLWLGSANDLRNANSLFLEVTKLPESDLVLPAHYMAGLSLYRLGKTTSDLRNLKAAVQTFKGIVGLVAVQGEKLNISAHCVLADAYIRMAKLHLIKAVNIEALDVAQHEFFTADSLFGWALDAYDRAHTLLEGFQTDTVFYNEYSNHITYGQGICHLHLAFSDVPTNFREASERFNALRRDVLYGPRSRYRLGDVAFGLSNLKEAQSAYKDVVTNYRTDVIANYANYWLAWTYFMEGNRLWRKGTDLMIGGKTAQARRSYRDAKRKYDGARRIFASLVKRYRTSPEHKLRGLTEDVRFRVGECYYRTEDYDLALQNYTKVKAVPQALSDRLELRILGCKRMLGDPWRQDFNRYLNTWSDSRLIGMGQYFLGEGVIASQKKDRDSAFNSARSALQKIGQRFPNSEFTNLSRFLVATSYHKQRNFGDARGWYDRCAGDYADEKEYAKGITYFDAEDYDNAITIFRPLVNRGHIRASYQMANCYFNQHNWPGAIRTYQKVINAFPSDPEHLWRKKAERSRENAYSNYPEGRNIRVSEGLGEDRTITPPITYETLQEDIFEQTLEKEAKRIWMKYAPEKLDLPNPVNDREYVTGVVELMVITKPEGVEVYVDGEYRRSTPFDSRIEVRRGIHNIRLEKEDECYTWEKELSLFQSKEQINVFMARRISYDEQIGKLEGDFRYPVDMTKDGEGCLYVADAGHGLVKKFGLNGKLDKEIGTKGLIYPTGVLVAGEKLFIVDSRANVVKRCNLDGEGLEIFLIAGRDWNKFDRPTDVAISGDNLYVVDSGNNRVLRFSARNGKFRPPEIGVGELNSPEGIAVDEKTGEIFVADWGNHRVVKFEDKGTLITTFGGINKPYELWSPTRLDIEYVTVDKDTHTFIFVVYDHEPKAVEKSNNIIKKFNSHGTELQTVNESLLPYSSFLDGSGEGATLYIVEKELDRGKIRKFKGR